MYVHTHTLHKSDLPVDERVCAMLLLWAGGNNHNCPDPVDLVRAGQRHELCSTSPFQVRVYPNRRDCPVGSLYLYDDFKRSDNMGDGDGWCVKVKADDSLSSARDTIWTIWGMDIHELRAKNFDASEVRAGTNRDKQNAQDALNAKLKFFNYPKSDRAKAAQWYYFNFTIFGVQKYSKGTKNRAIGDFDRVQVNAAHNVTARDDENSSIVTAFDQVEVKGFLKSMTWDSYMLRDGLVIPLFPKFAQKRVRTHYAQKLFCRLDFFSLRSMLSCLCLTDKHAYRTWVNSGLTFPWRVRDPDCEEDNRYTETDKEKAKLITYGQKRLDVHQDPDVEQPDDDDAEEEEELVIVDDESKEAKPTKKRKTADSERKACVCGFACVCEGRISSTGKQPETVPTSTKKSTKTAPKKKTSQNFKNTGAGHSKKKK